MSFCIYVHDARKGSTYRTGYESGYLRSDGSLSAWQKGLVIVDSIEQGNKEISERGLINDMSVIIGSQSAYVSAYLGD
jgi:hypothetical protein